jgi:hypothetical protein
LRETYPKSGILLDSCESGLHGEVVSTEKYPSFLSGNKQKFIFKPKQGSQVDGESTLRFLRETYPKSGILLDSCESGYCDRMQIPAMAMGCRKEIINLFIERDLLYGKLKNTTNSSSVVLDLLCDAIHNCAYFKGADKVFKVDSDGDGIIDGEEINTYLKHLDKAAEQIPFVKETSTFSWSDRKAAIEEAQLCQKRGHKPTWAISLESEYDVLVTYAGTTREVKKVLVEAAGEEGEGIPAFLTPPKARQLPKASLSWDYVADALVKLKVLSEADIDDIARTYDDKFGNTKFRAKGQEGLAYFRFGGFKPDENAIIRIGCTSKNTIPKNLTYGEHKGRESCGYFPKDFRIRSACHTAPKKAGAASN